LKLPFLCVGCGNGTFDGELMAKLKVDEPKREFGANSQTYTFV
jgi:hypothetical protein